MAQSPPPLMPSLNAAQLEELLARLRTQLRPDLYAQVEACLRLLAWIVQLLEQKKLALGRLSELLLRPRNEKTRKLFPEKPNRDPAAQEEPSKGQGQGKPKGHGRLKTQDYPGAQRICISHPEVRPGDICPQCQKGKVGPHRPKRLIWILARCLFEGMLYELEQLRCRLCGAVFSAPAPAQAQQSKYDASVGVMLGLLRYGAGLPMYRIAKWQQWFGLPMAQSTQWELIEEAAALPELIYEKLLELGAQGSLIHNDDTSMRVQSLRREIQSQNQKDGRTGIFTTSLICQVGSIPIGLYVTGRQHAGENLDQVLKRRAAGLDQPLQMCDALSRNQPKESQTIACHCLIHGRRNFVEQIENFPEACRQVIESIGQIYKVEQEIKKAGLSPPERLLIHQARSQPVMEKLRQWMTEQIQQKKVEPNSGLGKAIEYMDNHWEGLTRFLQVEAAPLDNNICERALKLVVLHRKNSLSYKTERGAKVGDVFMTLIHTCQLNSINPFDYMMALVKNAEAVRKDSGAWLPWNYQKTKPPNPTDKAR